MANENPKADLLVSEEMLNTYHNEGILPIQNQISAMQEAGAVNRNLCTYTSQVINGVTVTVNADGSITTSGEKIGPVYVYANNWFVLKKGTYKLSLDSTNKWFRYAVRLQTPAGDMLDVRASYEMSYFTLTEDTKVRLNFFIDGTNVTLSANMWRFMIYDARLNNPAYQPGAMTNRELTDVAVTGDWVNIVNQCTFINCTYNNNSKVLFNQKLKCIVFDICVDNVNVPHEGWILTWPSDYKRYGNTRTLISSFKAYGEAADNPIPDITAFNEDSTNESGIRVFNNPNVNFVADRLVFNYFMVCR